MPPDRMSTRSSRTGLLVLLWTVPGFVQFVQEVSWSRAQGTGELPLVRAFLSYVPSWYPWILVTPAVAWIARRHAPRAVGWWRSVPVHVLACVVIGAAHTALLGFVRTRFPSGNWQPPTFQEWMVRTFWSFHPQVEVLAYGVVVAVTLALDSERGVHERDMRTARLEGQLATARAESLRSQLQPHFLFNTLNAISVMMREDVDAAEKMLVRLSSLLRAVLDSEGRVHISLEEELGQLETYLAIQEVRFSDRLRFELSIDDRARRAAVPNLLLQPLVENAIQHGISPRARGGRIALKARIEGRSLVLELEDDGVGLDDRHVEGVGISNTRSRLRELYGEDQSFVIARADTDDRKETGTAVRIRLPFQQVRARDEEGRRVH